MAVVEAIGEQLVDSLLASGVAFDPQGRCTLLNRVGSYRSADTHACTDESVAISPDTISDEIGFRCCEDRN